MPSVNVSLTVLSFPDVPRKFTARQIRSLEGCLALLIAGVHLGLQWPVAMKVKRRRQGPTRRVSKQTRDCMPLRHPGYAGSRD
ncbi:hypothetical protein J5289_20005 [Rhizobium sp. B230/85]|uniref:hypothetical protein n=1 Tax=unclassified Rhizobium TaxID=2613769 RepID=UPI001ADAE371|nr:MULTISPECIES: hypothetical protein [unclassified Rhizobium]MBO9135376.1 hypothetical protein [Rhizobium sp. B209b/85]QXZ98823.1 hypothetical protein J5289_20005 [Rhizobium sp. B230/85]